MSFILKAAASVTAFILTCALTATTIVSAPTVAAADTGTKTSVTSISKTKVISQNMTVSAGDTIYVRDGGTLYINSGVKMNLLGSLKVADGGAVYVRGTIDAKENSLISNSGKIKIMSDGEIRLGGKLGVNPTGEIKGLGSLSVLNEFSDINCRGTVTVKITAPKPVKKDGLTYVGGILVVNKKYHLPQDYGTGLDRAAYSAYLTMKKESGYDMSLVSGFRSYTKQKETFEYWASVDGYDTALTYSALPGQSEHQTGLAMDISSLEQSYGKTAEGKWLAANCYKYGFVIRYPKGKENITGYMYEPWHVRYLGTSTAKLVYDSGLTLEEFLNIV